METNEAKAAEAKVVQPVDEPEFDLGTIEGKEFSTTLQEVKFVLDGQPHILREMDGTLRDQWHNDLFGKHMELKGDTYVTTNHDGLFAILLCRSILGPDGQFISYDKAKSLPSGLQTDLYHAARKISKLDRKKAKADATKNS